MFPDVLLMYYNVRSEIIKSIIDYDILFSQKPPLYINMGNENVNFPF